MDKHQQMKRLVAVCSGSIALNSSSQAPIRALVSLVGRTCLNSGNHNPRKAFAGIAQKMSSELSPGGTWRDTYA